MQSCSVMSSQAASMVICVWLEIKYFSSPCWEKFLSGIKEWGVELKELRQHPVVDHKPLSDKSGVLESDIVPNYHIFSHLQSDLPPRCSVLYGWNSEFPWEKFTHSSQIYKISLMSMYRNLAYYVNLFNHFARKGFSFYLFIYLKGQGTLINILWL